MCYSVTPTESSYTQVGLLPVLEILHNPAGVSAYSGLLGHIANCFANSSQIKNIYNTKLQTKVWSQH